MSLYNYIVPLVCFPQQPTGTSYTTPPNKYL